ncbi:MAG: hypothetical protein AB1486_25510 [Planctomycetota bacterium]
MPKLLAQALDARGMATFLEGAAERNAKDRDELATLLAAEVAHFRRKTAGPESPPVGERVEGAKESEFFAELERRSREMTPEEKAARVGWAARCVVEPYARIEFLIERLLDPKDLRPFAAKREASGLTELELQERHDVLVQKLRKAVVQKLVLPRLPGILEDLVGRAEKGESEATKLLLDFLCGVSLMMPEEGLAEELEKMKGLERFERDVRSGRYRGKRRRERKARAPTAVELDREIGEPIDERVEHLGLANEESEADELG